MNRGLGNMARPYLEELSQIIRMAPNQEECAK